MITTVLAFVVVLGVIVFVHEFGHLIVAKAFGMRVFIFSLGFGKRLLGFKWGDTDCRISAVPLGGYVKLEGEPEDLITPQAREGDRGGFKPAEDPATMTAALDDGTLVAVDHPDYFTNRPRWQRFLVYMAGPAMNALLTFTVLTVLYMVGYAEPERLSARPVIGPAAAGSPAEAAGLQAGDEIVAIDGKLVPTWADAMYAIVIRPDAEVLLRYRRDGQEREVRVRSSSTPGDKAGTIGVRPLTFIQTVTPGSPAAAAGLAAGDAIVRVGTSPIRGGEDVSPAIAAAGARSLPLRIYRDGTFLDLLVTPRDDGAGPKIGVQLGEKLVVARYALPGAVQAAARRTWEMTRQIFEIIGRLVTRRISAKTIGGPLLIAQQSGEAARQGAQTLWGFVAFISINVGILNLFPLVPLDGGHLAILALEGTVRRDLSPVVKGWIMNAGVAAILLLVVLVLFSDVSKMAFVQRIFR
jgi:regulator of sigma E protease